MSYVSWQEYWIKNGYGQTVGKIGGGSLVKGTLDTAHRFNPSSTERRYKLPGDAAPVWNEAGNVDPAVLEEWAAAHDVKIEIPAGATEQQDLKYVADGNGDTWYGDVLRPWTIEREADGGGKPVEEDDSVTLGELVSELGALVRKDLGTVEDSFREALENLAGELDRRLSAQDAQLRQIKAALQRLVPGKAAKS